MKLNNITLVTVDGVDPNLALKCLIASSSFIGLEFNKVLLLSFQKPDNIVPGIDFIQIERLDWIKYNDFIVHKLNSFIETEFCLLIQTDGFVLNPNIWDNNFLNYDYIGAPWLMDWHSKYDKLTAKSRTDFNCVGNGGFSLRSKKLLELSSQLEPICDYCEDAYICNNHKEYFLNNGVTFAPVDVALKFSQDPLPNRRSTFGFHGDKAILKDLFR